MALKKMLKHHLDLLSRRQDPPDWSLPSHSSNNHQSTQNPGKIMWMLVTMVMIMITMVIIIICMIVIKQQPTFEGDLGAG